MIASRARTERAHRVLLLRVHRQHEICSAAFVLDLLDEFDAVAAGHRQVEHEYVRVAVAHQRDRRRAVHASPTTSKSLAFFRMCRRPSDEGVVVGDEYRDHVGASSCRISFAAGAAGRGSCRRDRASGASPGCGADGDNRAPVIRSADS
jgi:hypothetical protein